MLGLRDAGRRIYQLLKPSERSVDARRRSRCSRVDANTASRSGAAPAGMQIPTETHGDIYERGGHGLLGTTVCPGNR